MFGVIDRTKVYNIHIKLQQNRMSSRGGNGVTHIHTGSITIAGKNIAKAETYATRLILNHFIDTQYSYMILSLNYHMLCLRCLKYIRKKRIKNLF